MAEEQKKKEEPNKNVLENAATGYGLEDHEATQQDPRVNELRRADSHHASKTQGNSQPKSPQAKSPPPGMEKVSEDRASNAATRYGLEDHKANTDDPRVNQIRQPKRQTEITPIPVSNENPPEAQPTVVTKLRSSLKRVSTGPNPPPPPPPPPTTSRTPYLTPSESSGTPVQPRTPATPPPAPVDGDATQDKHKRSTRVNKFTNTDVSFDPSKEYASKTTNTAGQMYSEEEESSASAPPPKPPVPTELNLDDCFAFAVALVLKAGAFALNSNKAKQRLSYTTKDHEHDLNTRTDNEVEAMLVSEITAKYPTHK